MDCESTPFFPFSDACTDTCMGWLPDRSQTTAKNLKQNLVFSKTFILPYQEPLKAASMDGRHVWQSWVCNSCVWTKSWTYDGYHLFMNSVHDSRQNFGENRVFARTLSCIGSISSLHFLDYESSGRWMRNLDEWLRELLCAWLSFCLGFAEHWFDCSNLHRTCTNRRRQV